VAYCPKEALRTPFNQHTIGGKRLANYVLDESNPRRIGDKALPGGIGAP
jgi:hypothetical protein